MDNVVKFEYYKSEKEPKIEKICEKFKRYC